MLFPSGLLMGGIFLLVGNRSLSYWWGGDVQWPFLPAGRSATGANLWNVKAGYQPHSLLPPTHQLHGPSLHFTPLIWSGRWVWSNWVRSIYTTTRPLSQILLFPFKLLSSKCVWPKVSKVIKGWICCWMMWWQRGVAGEQKQISSGEYRLLAYQPAGDIFWAHNSCLYFSSVFVLCL